MRKLRESREKKQSPSTRSGILFALGLSALVHNKLIEDAAQCQAERSLRSERGPHHENTDAIILRQRDRITNIRQARFEITHNRLDFWRFIQDAAATDNQEAIHSQEINPAQINRNLTHVVARLQTRWHNQPIRSMAAVRNLKESLRFAFQGLHYFRSKSSINPAKLFRDQGGGCGSISLAIVAALNKSGSTENLGIRFYEAGEDDQEAHLAPTLIFTDEQGVTQEVDLTTGHTAFPAGSRLSLAELVEAYAVHHQLPNTTNWPNTILVQGEDRDLGFAFPTPVDHRPYNNSDSSFYAEDIFTQDETGGQNSQTNRENEANIALTETQNRDRTNDFVMRNFYSQQVTQSNTDLGPNDVDVVLVPNMTTTDWTNLSNAISWTERHLRLHPQSMEYLQRLGDAIALYQLAHDKLVLNRQIDPSNAAADKLRIYRQRATEWFAAHQDHTDIITALRTVPDQSTFKERALALAVLGDQGSRILFDFYDYISEPSQTYNRYQALGILLISDSTRSEAMKRANALPLYERYYLIEITRGTSVHEDRQFDWTAINNMPAVFAGADEFSVAYRDQDNLFGTLFFRMIENIANRYHVTPLGSLTQLTHEIHQYAASHHKDAHWESETIAYGINFMVRLLPGLARAPITNDQVITSFNTFYAEAREWLLAHPNYHFTDPERNTNMQERLETHLF